MLLHRRVQRHEHKQENGDFSQRLADQREDETTSTPLDVHRSLAQHLACRSTTLVFRTLFMARTSDAGIFCQVLTHLSRQFSLR
jgi:hypothetical protein